MTGAGPTGPALTATGLVVRDGRRDIVTGWDLEIRAGQRIGVVGPSSSDVSTMLRVLAGLRTPASGTLAVEDRPVRSGQIPPGLSYLAQDHRLIGTLTAVENLLVAVLAAGRRSQEEIRTSAEEQLAALGLAPATWHNLVEQLSGGQQQRVALGRALVARPRVAVLDHPTSELDPDTVEVVDAVLTRAQESGLACVLSSDDDLILAACDRVVELG